MLSQQLTIVIPTYNEEKYISRTLMSIIRQIGIDGVKIIIADANSTDKTIEIINKVKDNHKLNLDIIQGGIPSIGRNNGAKLATTPYILFVDADVTFANKKVIARAVDELAFGNFDMVGTNPIYKGEFDIRAYIMFRINKYITRFLSKSKPFAIGGFMAVNRQVFNTLGGFDDKATQSEDWLLSKKILPKKFKLIPDLVTQDNRRFKRYGYFNMIKLLYNNWKNRNNVSYFYQDQGYWK